MPQRDALLPWRTVRENVTLGPEITGGRAELRAAREDARARLPLFGLTDFADAYPAELAGGMRQRAAFLRTVLTRRATPSPTHVALIADPDAAALRATVLAALAGREGGTM